MQKLNYFEVVFTFQRLPPHLINKDWAFKPAAPLVLDITNIWIENYHNFQESLSWLKEHNIKELKHDNHTYRTWLFPDTATKTNWLLINANSF